MKLTEKLNLKFWRKRELTENLKKRKIQTIKKKLRKMGQKPVLVAKYRKPP